MKCSICKEKIITSYSDVKKKEAPICHDCFWKPIEPKRCIN